VIEFIDVSKSYGSHPAVRDISLTIEEGARVAILGPSGCGKTTLLRLLAGFIAPDAGRLLIGGKSVAENGRILVAPESRNIGMVFQDLALWPHLTVRGNLEFGLRARKVPGREREKRIREVLELIHLTSRMDARPGELSGGQQQRVALARALVLRPRILLMDEPLSSLDRDLSRLILNEILALHKELQFTLIYVTHDVAEAIAIGSRIIEMKKGEVVKDIPSSSLKLPKKQGVS